MAPFETLRGASESGDGAREREQRRIGTEPAQIDQFY